MSSILVFDHIIVVVSDLTVATRQFIQLGFTVTPGGVHAGGFTHNALIAFADGTYIELLTTTRRSTATILKVIHFSRMMNFYPPAKISISKRLLTDIVKGVGLCDFALLSVDLDDNLNSIRQRGISLDGPSPGSRQRPDGEIIAWRTAIPSISDLPFLIEDITPRAFRVPGGERHRHANYVTGVSNVIIAVKGIEMWAVHYSALLGIEPQKQSKSSLAGMRRVDFLLGSTQLTLVEPAKENTTLRKFLANHQTRPLVIWLQTNSPDGSNLLALTQISRQRLTLSRSNPWGF